MGGPGGIAVQPRAKIEFFLKKAVTVRQGHCNHDSRITDLIAYGSIQFACAYIFGDIFTAVCRRQLTRERFLLLKTTLLARKQKQINASYALIISDGSTVE